MHYDPDEECKIMIDRIKEYCSKRNITPHGLAEKAGISTSTVSYIINGKTKPQIYTILQICNALDITMEQLFSDEEHNLNEEIRTEDLPIVMQEEKIIRLYRGFTKKKKDLLWIYVDMLDKYEFQ